MSLQFKIGLDSVASYRRLNYTPWHALAEFVDNSTQAYFDFRDDLDRLFLEENDRLEVSIVYDRQEGVIQVSDNSSGMDQGVLERALHVAQRPPNPVGRSKYGMGMKTAACWLGDVWSIKTKKFGSTTEYFVEVDVERVAQGDPELREETRGGLDENKHYTLIEIRNLRRSFQGRTIGKIKDFLRSMYREDLRQDLLTLLWNGEELVWEELDDRLLKSQDGKTYKKDFKFEVDAKSAHGWVGVLASGSRSRAGFSILNSGRVIKGWPDSWRPSSLYGQFQGSNDLINQRLVGEIHLDGFDVSHTKDDIDWYGDEQEIVETKLAEECWDYRQVAKEHRKGADQRGPSDIETETALEELKQELNAPEIVDAIELEVTPEPPAITEAFHTLIEEERRTEATFRVVIQDITLTAYVDRNRSPNDPYFVCDATRRDEVFVVINQAHPHWLLLMGSEGVLNFLRHCIYDALAEHMARHKKGVIEPDTIKMFKDKFLRIPFEVEAVQHEAARRFERDSGNSANSE